MKKDFELLIGRKIRGLKLSDVTGREFEMLLFLEANKYLFTGAWSYDENENMMHVKNGHFNCSFLFSSGNIYMLAKRLVKVKFEQVKEVKPVIDKWHKIPEIKIKPRQPQPVKKQPFNWSAYINM